MIPVLEFVDSIIKGIELERIQKPKPALSVSNVKKLPESSLKKPVMAIDCGKTDKSAEKKVKKNLNFWLFKLLLMENKYKLLYILLGILIGRKIK